MKINLKKKKLKTGKYSLYIEYYKGANIDANGKTKHNRDFEYLQQYLIIEPKNRNEKIKNKETLEFAENILALRKTEFLQGKYNLKDNQKGKIRFLDYYKKVKDARYDSKSNYDNWDAAEKHLERFCSSTLTFNEIDEDFIKEYKKHLDLEAKTRANTPLSQNSKYTYFNKFKACLREAFNEGYISTNYISKVKGFKMGESKREYLTHSELQALSNSYCKHQILKNAFIFSSLVGMRWADIHKMYWAEVRDEDSGARIIFSQKKTDGLEYLYISEQARKLLGKRQSNSDRVFQGLKYGAHFNAEILRWCMRAGITKHITFHSARHTNAVLLLENGADIYTVSKRLGHKELRTTEIYAKIIDSKMKEAANIIPVLNIEV